MNTVTIATLALVLDPKTAPRAKQQQWHSIPGTSNPELVLSVAEFADDVGERAWLARPGVVSLGEVLSVAALPAPIVTALTSLGAQTGDTLLTFLARLKQQWPGARPWFR